MADPNDNQGPIGVDEEKGEYVYDDACGDVRRALHEALVDARFPEADAPSSITYPIAFERAATGK